MNIDVLPVDCRSKHITVDVEEWFHILDTPIPPIEKWDHLTSTIDHNLDILLDIMQRQDIECTFFTLGWIAREYPLIVKRIVDSGHEIASHGFFHDNVKTMTLDEFYKDISDTKKLLEDISGQKVCGYRAPGFSAGNIQYLRQVAEAGYLYDSSVFPAKRDENNGNGMPNVPFRITWEDQVSLYEFPVSTTKFFNLTIPSGGGYFRIFPKFLLSRFYRKMLHESRGYMLFYIHPRELDGGRHPKLRNMKALKTFKTYINLKHTKDKFEWLCSNINSYKLVNIIESLVEHEFVKV